MPRLGQGGKETVAGFSAIPVWQPVVAVIGRDCVYDGLGLLNDSARIFIVISQCALWTSSCNAINVLVSSG